MKKVLVLIIIIVALLVGYLLGTGQKAKLPSEADVRDLRTATSVKTALALSKHLDQARIEVSVSNGLVTLTGAVPTDDQRGLAGDIAASIDGVTGVTNNLTVDPSLAAAAPGPERSLGQKLDDLTTTARVRAALALHRDLKEGNVAVSVLDGIATLTGTVPTWAARELAGKVAEDIEGVRGVHNELQVQGDEASRVLREAQPAPELEQPDATGGMRERVTDGSIRLQVEAALHVNPFIDVRRVHVQVERGHVRLTGEVRTEADKALAQKIAEDCWGVTGVTNDIAVNPTPEQPLQYAPSGKAAREPLLQHE